MYRACFSAVQPSPPNTIDSARSNGKNACLRASCPATENQSAAAFSSASVDEIMAARAELEAATSTKEKNDKELAEEAALQQAKKQVAVGSLQALAALSDAFTKGDEKRAERNFKINKAIGLANAVINTAEGITAALTDKTQPSTILRIAQTAIVAATGLAQIATISKQTWPPKDTQAPPPPGASGGGGSMGSSAPQIDLSFMNGSQTSGFRSYVLASDVSNAQQANQKMVS